MAILVNKDSRVVCQGITGRNGAFHSLACRDYGTNMVAGVTPGKEGQSVEGIPVFNSVSKAVRETGADVSIIFIPARICSRAHIGSRGRGHSRDSLHN